LIGRALTAINRRVPLSLGDMELDARVHYQWYENWSLSAGVDNLNNDKYFLFHPFPQRSFVMEIHCAQ
jgi:hypothetical protein